MTKVYVLQHEHEHEGSSDVKMIGVYGTEHEAAEARKRLLEAPGFRDRPEGFSIDAYELGQDHWTEGYVSAPLDPDETGTHTQAA